MQAKNKFILGNSINQEMICMNFSNSVYSKATVKDGKYNFGFSIVQHFDFVELKLFTVF